MGTSIVIRLIRPALIDGKHAAAGSRLTVAPLAAADLLAARRAELAHADDMVLVQRAVADDVRLALRRSGAPMSAPSLPPPWRPI